jgi:hypothetical protein
VKTWTEPTVLIHLEMLACEMRDSDLDELTTTVAAAGRSFDDLLDELVLQTAQSLPTSLFCEDGLIGIAGIDPIPGREGHAIAWFLGTDLADLHWRAMTRFCAKIIADYVLHADKHPTWIGNIMPKGHSKRERWLNYLGFDISNAQAQGPFQDFILFSMNPVAPKLNDRLQME